MTLHTKARPDQLTLEWLSNLRTVWLLFRPYFYVPLAGGALSIATEFWPSPDKTTWMVPWVPIFLLFAYMVIPLGWLVVAASGQPKATGSARLIGGGLAISMFAAPFVLVFVNGRWDGNPTVTRSLLFGYAALELFWLHRLSYAYRSTLVGPEQAPRTPAWLLGLACLGIALALVCITGNMQGESGAWVYFSWLAAIHLWLLLRGSIARVALRSVDDAFQDLELHPEQGTTSPPQRTQTRSKPLP